MATLTTSLGRFESQPWIDGFRPVYHRPEDPSLTQTLGAAVNSEWSLAWAARWLNRSWQGGYDASFDPQKDTKVWNELTDGVNPDYWGEFGTAGNLQEAMAIADGLRSVTASRELLGRAGVTGAVASLGAAILDPVSIAAGFGVGGIVGKAGVAAGRFGRFAAGGVAGMASEVPIEGFLTLNDPDRGATDILLAGIGSFTLGGIGSQVGHAMTVRAARKDLAAIPYAMGAAAAEELRPKTLGEVMAQATDPDLKSSIRAGMENAGIHPELIDEAVGPRWGETKARYMEGASTAKDDPTLYNPDAASDEPAALAGVRRSLVSYLAAPNATREVRKLGNGLLTDWLRKAGGSASTMGADVAQHAIHEAKITELGRVIRTAMKEFPEESGGLRGRAREREFFAATIQEIEKPGSFNNKAVQKAAEGGRAWYKGYLDLLKKEGVIDEESYAALSQNLNYFPRYLRPNNIRSFIGRFADGAKGREALRQVFTNSMRLAAGTDDISFNRGRDVLEGLGKNYKLQMQKMTGEERARHVANKLTDFVTDQDTIVAASDAARRSIDDDFEELDDIIGAYADHYRTARFYLQTAENLGSMSDADTFRLFNGKQLESLRRILRDQQFDVDTLSDENIATIIARIEKEGAVALSESERGVAGNLRQRTPLDRYATTKVDIDGEVVDVSPNDFFDNNFARASYRYSRAMSSQIVMRKFYAAAGKTLGRAEGEPILTRQAFMSALEGHLKDNKLNPADSRAGENIYRRFDAALREIHGIPPDLDHASSLSRQLLRSTRRFANVVRNGSFAFAQIPELGRIVAYNGIRNTIESIPALREMHKLAKAGKMSNDIYEFGDMLSGIMGTHEWNDAWSAFDPDDLREFGETTRLERFDSRLARLERASFFLSGFAHIDRQARRLSMAATLNKFINDFSKGRPWNAKKLASLGLTEADAARISAAITDEVKRGAAIKREPGFMGQRVAKFRVSEFKDQYAVSKLVQAIRLSTDRTIQQSTTGSKLLWQQNPIGQAGFQFWSFAIQGWEKHTLAGFQTLATGGDRAGVAWSYLTGTLLGAMTYLGQTQLNAIGRGDKEEYLGKQLGEGDHGLRLLAAGLQRGGNLTFLPQLADMVAIAFGQDAPFDARASGLTWSGDVPIIQANPTTALMTDAFRAVSGAGSALFGGDDYSEQDFRALTRIVPLQNHLGFRQFLNAAAARFGPEERE